MPAINKPSFRFRLRTALGLVAMIALILGWLVDHRRMDDRIAKLEVQNQIYERQFADLQTRLDRQLMGMQMIYTWANATEFIQA